MTESSTGKGRPFLGVHFKFCNVYGRLYPNKDKTAYIGSCPKCGRPVRVAIGKEGTNNRFFDVYCNTR